MSSGWPGPAGGHPPVPPAGWTPAPGPAPGWAPPGTPHPGWPPPGSAGPPPPPPSPSQGGRNRKALIFAAVAATALLVVGMGLVAIRGGGDKQADASTPTGAVTAYLDALSRGDAAEALSYSDFQPPTTDFLTDDILRRQLDTWPVTDIQVLGENGGPNDTAYVHVLAHFGEKTSDVTLKLKKSVGQWLLESGVATLRPRPFLLKDTVQLTLFGTPVERTGEYFVFPGWIDYGTTNPNLAATAESPLLQELSRSMSLGTVLPKFALSDAGKQAVTDAAGKQLSACAGSTKLTPPPPCPASLGNDPDLVEDSAKWGAPDLTGLTFDRVNPALLTAGIGGEVSFPVSVETRSGGRQERTVTFAPAGGADLNTNPPDVWLKR